MGILARQLLFGVCAVVLVIDFANAVNGETAPIVVGLAKCSDCARKNMNAEAAFKGLQVAVKCKNSKGEYESKAVGQVDKSGAFSVPLAADLVGEDGELKQDCLAQLHSASSTPCPGQEPSKIIAAQPSQDGKKTFVALAGKMHQPSAECASAFLCDPLHKHLHHLIPHKPVVVPPKHSVPPVIKPPVTVPEHKPPSTPVYTPTLPKPTPIYHPPAQHDAATDPQQFKKLLPFLKKLPFFPPGVQKSEP